MYFFTYWTFTSIYLTLTTLQTLQVCTGRLRMEVGPGFFCKYLHLQNNTPAQRDREACFFLPPPVVCLLVLLSDFSGENYFDMMIPILPINVSWFMILLRSHSIALTCRLMGTISVNFLQEGFGSKEIDMSQNLTCVLFLCGNTGFETR